MQRRMTTTLDAEHLVSRGTTHLGQPAANAAQVCPNLSVHRELDSMWRTGTEACDKIRQQDSYDTHTIMRNNLPARHFSSTNVQLIRQLHALHSDWSGCIGEPILLSALQKVSIAADLAPTQPKQLKFFYMLRANGVPGKCLPSFPTENKEWESNYCGCLIAALYLPSYLSL
jgi:hypothetical protein